MDQSKTVADLNLKYEVVASEGKSNNPKCIKHTVHMLKTSPSFDWIVRHSWKPTLCHGHHPYGRTVPDGCYRSDQRDSSDRVQVGQLRKRHCPASKDQVPLHRRQWRLCGACSGPTDDLVEELGRGSADDDQCHTSATYS